MGVIQINQELCDLCKICMEKCPFKAIELKENKIEINAGCKMCRICIKSCPNQAITYEERLKNEVNKEQWKGILVFVEHVDGEIHPITLELLGKARQLAQKVGHPVYCLFIGNRIEHKAQDLLYYGVDKVFLYDHEALKYYRVDVYANVFEDCIKKIKPCCVLVGGTSIGRSLAPRVATRFKTGLTADCTVLDMKDNTDLIQIRPAFGGNIMAQIVTPNTRPQFATVRYKVMDEAQRCDQACGTIERMSIEDAKLKSKIKVIEVVQKQRELGISEAQVLVVGGRGLKESKDLALLEELATLLGGQVAVTRPLVEAGWAPHTRQIGLSGRTVKPKLIITCGVSGAIQFTACMDASERIIAINKDKNAPIFKIAHYGIVADLYEVIPLLIQKIKEDRKGVEAYAI